MDSMKVCLERAKANVEHHQGIVQNLDASIADLAGRRPQTADHQYNLLALQAQLMSALTGVLVAKKVLNGLVWQRRWRKFLLNLMEGNDATVIKIQFSEKELVEKVEASVGRRRAEVGLGKLKLWAVRKGWELTFVGDGEGEGEVVGGLGSEQGIGGENEAVEAVADNGKENKGSNEI